MIFSLPKWSLADKLVVFKTAQEEEVNSFPRGFLRFKLFNQRAFPSVCSHLSLSSSCLEVHSPCAKQNLKDASHPTSITTVMVPGVKAALQLRRQSPKNCTPAGQRGPLKQRCEFESGSIKPISASLQTSPNLRLLICQVGILGSSPCCSGKGSMRHITQYWAQRETSNP